MDSKIKKLRTKLGQMASMKHKYGLTASSIENYIKDTEHFQVVTPLIGEFSTGKSSLINTLLGRKLLGEGIEPKTAVPTEICYGSQEQAVIYAKDGNRKTFLDRLEKTRIKWYLKKLKWSVSNHSPIEQ